MASDSFINYITEVIYGDEATKHDKQNVKKKYLPILDEKESLHIRDIHQSYLFVDGFRQLHRDLEEQISQTKLYKMKYNKQKEQPIPDIWMDKYTDLQNECESLKQQLRETRKDKINEYNDHPYCQHLLIKTQKKEEDLDRQVQEYLKLSEQTIKQKEKYDTLLEEYSREKCSLEEEFERKKASYIRKAKADNKEEERLEIKMLKENIKKLKRTIEKRDKKIKRLVAEMSESSDSDTD